MQFHVGPEMGLERYPELMLSRAKGNLKAPEKEKHMLGCVMRKGALNIFKLNPKPQILILLSFIVMRIIYSQYSFVVLTKLS